MGSPFLKESLRRPFHSSMRVRVAPTRRVTPCCSSHRATMFAHASSTMRGRMRGATSTMVSEAPRARMAFKMVKAMKPAPTMTTLVEGPEGMYAGQLGAFHGRPHRARAGGDHAVVVLHGGPVVEGERTRHRVERLGATAQHGLHLPGGERGRGGRVHVRLRDGGAQVVRQHHAGVRALRGDEGDLGGAAVLFPDGPDGVEAGRPAPDDEMPRWHHATSRARTRDVRSAAKSPIQSAVSPSTKVMASVGQASAQAGWPSHRLHL